MVCKPRPWLHMASHSDWDLGRTAAEVLRAAGGGHSSAQAHTGSTDSTMPLLHPDRLSKSLSGGLIFRFLLPVSRLRY